MSWDLRLNKLTRDLTSGIITGPEEVMQRLITRLNRELGEWFLATDAGLPWYQEGNGLLGSRDKKTLELLIRRETLRTTGVNRIVTMNTLFSTTTRSFTIYMQIIVELYGRINFTLTEEGASWFTA